MLNIAQTSADVTQIVRASFDLFSNDIAFMDADLTLVASICYKEDSDGKIFVEDLDPYSRIMPAEIASGFRKEYRQNMARHGMYIGEGGCYCINFFSNDVLTGTLSLNPTHHPFRTSDSLVFQTLAEKLQPAVQNLYERKRVEKTNLNQKLLSLLNGVPGDDLGISDGDSIQYLCVCIDPTNGIQQFLSTPERFCSFSPKGECRKMAGKGVQPLNNYTRRFRPSSLKCTDKSGLDGLQAGK